MKNRIYLFLIIIKLFLYSIKTVSEISGEDVDVSKPNVEKRQIPMVCLVIRGDLNSIESIEFKVKKEIPVVILKGSGGASDIISFAIEEMADK